MIMDEHLLKLSLIQSQPRSAPFKVCGCCQRELQGRQIQQGGKRGQDQSQRVDNAAQSAEPMAIFRTTIVGVNHEKAVLVCTRWNYECWYLLPILAASRRHQYDICPIQGDASHDLGEFAFITDQHGNCCAAPAENGKACSGCEPVMFDAQRQNCFAMVCQCLAKVVDKNERIINRVPVAFRVSVGDGEAEFLCQRPFAPNKWAVLRLGAELRRRSTRTKTIPEKPLGPPRFWRLVWLAFQAIENDLLVLPVVHQPVPRKFSSPRYPRVFKIGSAQR